MTTTKTSKLNLIREAEALSRVEYLVQTNSGTFGSAEAARKIGTGDPQFATYRVYETVGGSRRHTGCDFDKAPGYDRRLNSESLAADRKRLAEIRKQINAAK